MTSLPKGWMSATIGEVCSKPQYGWTSKAGRSGQLRYLRTTDISGGEICWDTVPFCIEEPVNTEKYQLEVDDILVSRAGSVGVSYRMKDVPHDVVFASYLIRFRALDGIVEPKLIEFFLQSDNYWRAISECTAGIAIPNVNASKLAELEIPLPPLNEQRRILTKLEELLGKARQCRQRLEKIPSILKRFRQAVLAAACSGRLTSDWREEVKQEDAGKILAKIKGQRPPRLQDFSVRSDLQLPDVPSTWAWTNLRFLLSAEEAFCYGVVQPGENDPEGAYLVRAGDLIGGRVDTSALRRIPAEVHSEYRRSHLVGGEILVTVVGAGIGQVAIAQAECAGFNIARAVAKLPVRDFDASYVYLWLSTPRALAWMKSDSREVARPTLNLEQLQTLPVPVPPPAEQHEIVTRVTALFALADQLETRYMKANEHVACITQSILSKAFCGELVSQNLNDEPASSLLERVRTERAHEPQAPHTHVRRPRKRRGNQQEPLPMVAEAPETHASSGRETFSPQEKQYVHAQTLMTTHIPQRIIAHMQTGRECSRGDIIKATGISATDWNWAIRQLKEEGKVRQCGEKRGARYVRVK